MMFLIIWTKPTKYFHSFFCGRLLHSHRLESSFQCCVFLNIFTVFFQSCGPNKLDLSSGQGWFQNIGSIQCTFCASGTDNGVKFINKQKNSLMFPYFLYNILNSFFEFTSVFTSRNHSGKIKNYKTFILHCIRDHSHNDPLCKAFCNGSFTHSGFSHQAGVVLGSSA